ncbi:MAG: dipeptidase [Limnochordales bacterium]|nr:MAG: dipeptidase [Bacillota bacterium]
MSDVHRLHRESFVVDAHCDTALRLAAGDSLTPGGGAAPGHVDLPRLRAGGVDLQVFALWVDADSRKHGRLRRCLELLDAVVAETERLRDDFRLVLSARDIDAAAQAGQIGVLLSIEDGAALEGSLSALRAFYRLGVRAMGLTWNGRNELGEGVGAAKGAGGGLTAFGRDVVREMNRLGMIVDVSHLSEAGFWDVLEISDAPVIASHSNAKAVCDHRRNLTDRQIKALADAGGVMGINFCPPFLADGGRASVEDIVRHVDHIVDLVGPGHVGLGSDFDGISSTPEGAEDVARLPAVTEALAARGYGDEEIRAILGGNFLRVFRQILQPAD